MHTFTYIYIHIYVVGELEVIAPLPKAGTYQPCVLYFSPGGTWPLCAGVYFSSPCLRGI